jgi:hypothetical protein
MTSEQCNKVAKLKAKVDLPAPERPHNDITNRGCFASVISFVKLFNKSK